MERTLRLGAGIAIGVGVSAIVQRLIVRRSALRSARPLRMRSAVPPSQLCPSEFEEPSTDGRLLRRTETVVQRRTARIMLVLERTRDIAILKAMGARNGSILSIFLAEGLAIGVMGTAIGMTAAYALCEGLLANGISLDAKVYGIARLPVVFEPWDYVMAAIGAMVITLVASMFPALRGARLHPVDGLREVVG